MDAAETPRRRRRAARRAAGPPAQVRTTPVADPPDDADPAGLAGSAGLGETAGLGDNADRADAGGPPATGRGIPLTRTIDEPGDFGIASSPDSPALSPVLAGEHEVVHGSPGDAPAGPSHTPGPQRDRADRAPATAASTGEPSRRSGRTSREEASERSLRSLVTTRSTQVSSTAALRAREVALPSSADLAAAEDGLIMVRRHYVPPTTLATGRRPDRTGRRSSGQDG